MRALWPLTDSSCLQFPFDWFLFWILLQLWLSCASIFGSSTMFVFQLRQRAHKSIIINYSRIFRSRSSVKLTVVILLCTPIWMDVVKLRQRKLQMGKKNTDSTPAPLAVRFFFIQTILFTACSRCSVVIAARMSYIDENESIAAGSMLTLNYYSAFATREYPSTTTHNIDYRVTPDLWFKFQIW